MYITISSIRIKDYILIKWLEIYFILIKMLCIMVLLNRSYYGFPCKHKYS